MSDLWISVRNWRTFQHYDPSKRVPPWIKNHTELMAAEAYLGLTEHRALMLHRLWLEYASSRCRLSLDTRLLSRRLNMRVALSDIEALVDAGFIDIVASKLLAEGYHSASASRAREETETEVETELTPSELVKRQTDIAKGEERNQLLPISTQDIGTAPLVEKLLSQIRDADEQTTTILTSLATRLPDAAFASALESLQHRRQRTDRKPLVSEARYVVAALTTMEREHIYEVVR